MTPGLPGAGIGGMFYLLAAMLTPVFEVFRTVRGTGSWRQRRLAVRHFLLAASILAMLWLTVWAAGVVLTSRGVLAKPLRAPAIAVQTELISQRIAASTVTVLGLVLAGVELLRLVVIRPNHRGRAPASRIIPEKIWR